MTTPVLVTVTGAPREHPGASNELYQSLFVIGRGGMGSVEVALERSEGGGGRVVALKRLLPESARDPRRKEMFLREAHLASLLDHRNVVHTFAFGEHRGELFLTMEYVEGEPLSRVLSTPEDGHPGRQLGLDPSLVSYVLAEVCEGLHAAHELRDAAGRLLHVVHRDVSPHNVMIAYEGQVKLLDFGVAKFEASGHETRTGEVKGKMAYMSPEQALGEKLDRRTDLYSVGALLFECLTGARMWGSGTDLEIMRKLALEEPPRLDRAWPDAPFDLVDLHARLVARDPLRRPATALEVAGELRAFAGTHQSFPCGAALQALMSTKFGAQAQRRRALLIESLEKAAPSQVNVIRRSLVPEEPDRPSPLTDAMTVHAPTAPHRTSRGILLVALAVALLAGAKAAVAIARRAEGPPAQAQVTRSVAPTSPVVVDTNADPVPRAPAQASSAAVAPTNAVPSPTASSTPAAVLAPRAIPSPTNPHAPSLPRPTRPSPPKLPDVDPTPF